MAKQPRDDDCAPLTARLADMLWARACGHSYNDIGAARGIKAETVQACLRRARTLLEVATESEAIREAARRRIFDHAVLWSRGPDERHRNASPQEAARRVP